MARPGTTHRKIHPRSVLNEQKNLLSAASWRSAIPSWQLTAGSLPAQGEVLQGLSSVGKKMSLAKDITTFWNPWEASKAFILTQQ